MKEPTMEEILEIVSFWRTDEGKLQVCEIKGNILNNVYGNVCGEVKGDVAVVRGRVRGRVYGDTKMPIEPPKLLHPMT